MLCKPQEQRVFDSVAARPSVITYIAITYKYKEKAVKQEITARCAAVCPAPMATCGSAARLAFCLLCTLRAWMRSAVCVADCACYLTPIAKPYIVHRLPQQMAVTASGAYSEEAFRVRMTVNSELRGAP